MSKHQAEPNRHLASCVVLGVTLAISALPATASAGVAFTWDPAGASPPLAGAGSAFTADTIYGGHYLWSLGPAGPPTVAHPGRIFQVDFYEQVQQFSLGSGAPFVPTGLNGPEGASGSYGLYVKMTVEVEQVGAPNIYDYHSLTMSLMADPGNNDGVLSATASGVGFANGTTGDITLAMGSLISSSFQLNPTTGIRSIGHFTESFQPSSGEGGFFVTPVSPYTVLEEFLTIPTMGPGAIQTMLDSSDPSSQYQLGEWCHGGHGPARAGTRICFATKPRDVIGLPGLSSGGLAQRNYGQTEQARANQQQRRRFWRHARRVGQESAGSHFRS